MHLRIQVQQMMKQGMTNEALGLLQNLISKKSSDISDGIEKSDMPEIDELHYLVGNIFYKLGRWKDAIQHYLEATELNSNSPAKEKLKMAYSILEFYNKDIYGQ